MRPVFEETVIPLQKRRQVPLFVGLSSRENDFVMGPANRVDAVDLHKPDPFDQIQQVQPLGRPNRSLGQGVTVKEDPARGTV